MQKNTQSPATRRQSNLLNLKINELPKDFSEQILQNDIRLVMSKYKDQDALNNLIQLYMKGVEYYESNREPQNEYFKAKLHWLMNHPDIYEQQNVVQQQKNNNKLEFKTHTLNVSEKGHYEVGPVKINDAQVAMTQNMVEVKGMIENLKRETQKINKVISRLQQIIQNDLQSQTNSFTERLDKRSKSIHSKHSSLIS